MRKLVTFGRILREAGLEVGPGRMQDALLGLAAVDLTNRDDVYWALRCTIVSRRDDIEVFDTAFASFWERAPRIELQTRPIELSAELPEDSQKDDDAQSAEAEAMGREMRDGQDAEQTGDEEKEETAAAVWSADEQLRDRDFARYGPDELRRARALVARVARAAPRRRSLRRQPSPSGRTFDPRRTLREAMRTGGVPIERAWREPKLVPRKLVYLVDVSGSMEPYARAMVMFLQAAVRAGRHVEAFTFGTRLTRLTPHLAGRDPDRALANAARAVPDWAGGTRIGENLKAFNDVWGRRGTDARRHRRDRLGRLGARGSHAARRADEAPAPGRPPHRLDEPARRRRGLPAAGRRNAGRAALCRRFPARSQPARARDAGRGPGGDRRGPVRSGTR